MIVGAGAELDGFADWRWVRSSRIESRSELVAPSGLGRVSLLERRFAVRDRRIS